MVIAGREITQEEAQDYYTRNKERIRKRKANGFGPENAMTKAYIDWNKRIEQEFDIKEN